MMFWRKTTISAFIPGQMRPQEFPNYSEMFVRDNTTADDEGIYSIQPQFKSGTTQSHALTPSGGVDFGVIAPGMALISSCQLINAFLISQSTQSQHLSTPLLL